MKNPLLLYYLKRCNFSRGVPSTRLLFVFGRIVGRTRVLVFGKITEYSVPNIHCRILGPSPRNRKQKSARACCLLAFVYNSENSLKSFTWKLQLSWKNEAVCGNTSRLQRFLEPYTLCFLGLVVIVLLNSDFGNALLVYCLVFTFA